VDGAEEGKNHDGPENGVAMRAEDALRCKPKREVVAGNVAHGENVKNGGVDKQIDHHDGKKTGKNGARHQVAGVLDFIAEVDDTIPAIVCVDRGLNAEQESGDESGADGNDGRSGGLCKLGGFGGVTRVATESEAGNDNGKEGQGLEEGGEVLHLAAHADAFPLQHRKENDHGDSGDFDAQAAIHNREDVRHILADDDADGASGTAGGQPIAPANDESGILAERAARKIILAAAFWDGGAKFGKLEGADKSVERSAKPDAEEEPVIGQPRGDVAGSAYDAGANGIAHGHGNAK